MAQKITDSLANLRSRIEHARTTDDVADDPVALKALAQLEKRISEVEMTSTQLSQNPTWENYEVARQSLHEIYVAAGHIMEVGATAATRRGGYKGAATTNTTRAMSSDTRNSINVESTVCVHPEWRRKSPIKNSRANYKLSDRTIRRAVKP